MPPFQINIQWTLNYSQSFISSAIQKRRHTVHIVQSAYHIFGKTFSCLKVYFPNQHENIQIVQNY